LLRALALRRAVAAGALRGCGDSGDERPPGASTAAASATLGAIPWYEVIAGHWVLTDANGVLREITISETRIGMPGPPVRFRVSGGDHSETWHDTLAEASLPPQAA
jgi:hypothetical protein